MNWSERTGVNGCSGRSIHGSKNSGNGQFLKVGWEARYTYILVRNVLANDFEI
jgi:hypothetical protein